MSGLLYFYFKENLEHLLLLCKILCKIQWFQKESFLCMLSLYVFDLQKRSTTQKSQWCSCVIPVTNAFYEFILLMNSYWCELVTWF